jgi:hypothetical protein
MEREKNMEKLVGSLAKTSFCVFSDLLPLFGWCFCSSWDEGGSEHGHGWMDVCMVESQSTVEGEF